MRAGKESHARPVGHTEVLAFYPEEGWIPEELRADEGQNWDQVPSSGFGENKPGKGKGRTCPRCLLVPFDGCCCIGTIVGAGDGGRRYAPVLEGW